MEQKVSIIVPVYNVERYIRLCLNSIREQEYKNIEVIMVNDGTPDDSAEICREFAEKDARFVLYDKQNGGLSSARNYGLDRASGDYVCFIDSDDYICKNYVSDLVSCMSEGVDIVIAKYILKDGNAKKEYVPYADNVIDRALEGEEKTEEIVYKHIDAKRDGEYIIKGSIMPVWKNLYRRSFIEENSLRFVSEREVYAEDYIFNLQAYILAKKIFVSSSAAYVHLIVRGSLSQGYRPNMLNMAITRYNYEKDILARHYGEDVALLARHKLPLTLGDAVLHLCRCKRKKAIEHIRDLVSSPFAEEIFEENKKTEGKAHFRVIYSLIRKKRVRTTVTAAKIMMLGEGVYRFINRMLKK